MEKILWEHIGLVRRQSPLVHNITNFVVMNNTANALLAAGASPVMVHAKSEVKDLVKIAQSLVINIGTLDEYWADAMLAAAETAQAEGKPWVLDPVGAGATPYRDKVINELMRFKPTAVRGNASEIMAIANENTTVTKGVDSTAESTDATGAAERIADRYGSVVCISGETDFIIDCRRTLLIKNGHPMMTKVTGLGCSASALTGAFIGVAEDKTIAVAAAAGLMAVAGELAMEQSDGPGSLQVNLLDKLYNITEREFIGTVKISVL